jgi:hypothetical protein
MFVGGCLQCGGVEIHGIGAMAMLSSANCAMNKLQYKLSNNTKTYTA